MENPKEIHQPHDRAYKIAMRDVRVARDFFEHYLPAALKSKIDLSTLQLRKETYLDSQLKFSASDVLYAVKLRDVEKPSQSAYLYILTDHQSEPDKLMPWRIIKYTCSIIEQHLRETQATVLPVVWPMLFYNGKVQYPYSAEVFDLFGENAELARHYMFRAFQLVDMTQVPDAEIRQHRWSSLMEMVLKHVRTRDMLSFLTLITDNVQAILQAQADDYVLGMLRYAWEKADIADRDAFFNWLHHSFPKPLEEKVMSFAEQLRSEGRSEGYQHGLHQGLQDGLEKGMERGIRKGLLDGERTLFMRLLKHKFSVVPDKYLPLIDQADAERLLAWGERILDAKTLRDIFDE